MLEERGMSCHFLYMIFVSDHGRNVSTTCFTFSLKIRTIPNEINGICVVLLLRVGAWIETDQSDQY